MSKHLRAVAAKLVVLVLINLTFSSQMAVAQSYFARKAPNSAQVLIFVHGVLGGAQSTWSNGKASWPAMIAADPAFDKIDVFVVSYPTSFWGNLSIDELAETIRLEISGHGVLNYPRLAFVAHSMGGLVTRAYLLKNRLVAEKTDFVYFFSAPTTGAQITVLASLISRNPQFQAMKPMLSDDYLSDQVRGWLAAGFSFPSYCAYEKQTTMGFEVVTFTAASPLCSKAIDPINADHFDIVKPVDRGSASYLAVKAAYESEASKVKTGVAKADSGNSRQPVVNQTCTGNDCIQVNGGNVYTGK
jgi:pimeloyl-ACP methyl ester carboxylesterase